MLDRKMSLDFSPREHWVVESALEERYGKRIDIQQADVELRLDPALPDLTEYPALVWKVGRATFVISKLDDECFRSQFFYSVREQYGTGKEDYDDLSECVTTLLKLQADHERSAAEYQ